MAFIAKKILRTVLSSSEWTVNAVEYRFLKINFFLPSIYGFHIVFAVKSHGYHFGL